MISNGSSHESSRHVIKYNKCKFTSVTCSRRCSRNWFFAENIFCSCFWIYADFEMITFTDDSPCSKHLERLRNEVALITRNFSENEHCLLCKSGRRFLGCRVGDNSAKKRQSRTCDLTTDMRCNDNSVHEIRAAKHRDCPIDVVFIPLGVILPLPTNERSLSRLTEGSIDWTSNIEPRN